MSIWKPALFVWAFLVFSPQAHAADAPDVKQDFISNVFSDTPPMSQTLWLNRAQKKDAKKILRHDYGALRVRYWKDEERTVWVLDEIGKYKPITVGLVINDGSIEKLSVLAYRESHGWEVKHDFFTHQFIGAKLSPNWKMDQGIDGISGATLSVRALKKLARLALYFDQEVNGKP